MRRQPQPSKAAPLLRLVRDEETGSVLRRDTEIRLRNQLSRAFRQSFGAEYGLRVLVGLATTQLMEAGSSREEVRAILCRLVEERVEDASEKSPAAARARGAELTTLMLNCSDLTVFPETR